ncbi:MAG: carboxypeptidase regulatory-like domain-containing protein, partial [Bacteroidales bacterium]|nr:carboxypeptidase regulatory-like domain-containing protein [Bacteroidales bacterium]
MLLKRLVVIIGFLLLAGVETTVNGQVKGDIPLDLFKDRVELYFKFKNSNPKELDNLSRIISISEVNDDEIFAYANKKGFGKFLEMDLQYTVLTPPGMLIVPKMLNSVNSKAIAEWDFYPTYEAYVDMMYQFASDYPDLCEVFSIGQTVEGRELLFARISDNVSQDEGEAQFMYTGTMHGEETTGYVLLLRLIDYLLSNYGTDPQITNLVQNLEIWINPAANPDGTYAGGNNTVYGAIRFNANGVDLNRNYPDPEDGPHPDGEEWQPETLAFMELAENNHFVLSSNIHSGAEVCNYPWDTWAQLQADADWWQYVCHEYADTAQAYSPPGYMNGFDDGITNGYAWLTINGGRQDYMNYFQQCREFTLELSECGLPPANELPAFWEYNYRSFLTYIEQTLFGISGTVTDANTGNPLAAKVIIENHDTDSSMVFTNESYGKYFRPVYEGTYDVTFSAQGYYPQPFENIEVQNKGLTILDVELIAGDLIADLVASATSIPVDTSIYFTDLTYGSPVSWEWTFEGAVPSASGNQNPTGITYNVPGTFDVSLTVSDGTDSHSITKEDYISVSTEYLMQNTTVTTCEGIFYDTGGPSSDYSNDEDFTMTFLPAQNDKKIEISFTYFSVENELDCNYDWMKIFDGSSISYPLIGTYCGIDSPGTVAATNNDGALTFQFHSDYSIVKAGWIANISCLTTVLPPVADFTADTTVIF